MSQCCPFPSLSTCFPLLQTMLFLSKLMKAYQDRYKEALRQGSPNPRILKEKKSTRLFCTSLLPKKGCSFGLIFLAFSSLPGRRAGLLQFPADFCHPMSSSQLPVLVSLPLQLFMLPLPDRVTKGFTHIFTYLYIYSFNSVHT